MKLMLVCLSVCKNVKNTLSHMTPGKVKTEKVCFLTTNFGNPSFCKEKIRQVFNLMMTTVLTKK